MPAKKKKIINKTQTNITNGTKKPISKKTITIASSNSESAIRKRVVITGGNLLTRQGYHGTGINQIVEESQTPKGSLYHNFPSGKDQIVIESLIYSTGEWFEKLDSILNKASNPSDAIIKICKFLADDLAKSNWENGCPIATVTLEVASQKPAIQEISQKHWKRWEEKIHNYLKDNKVKSTSPELVNLIITSIEGSLLLA
ncbi:MAG: TetR/AcrR family transcriptional regulator, partial [Leptospira sp.]|nr:TetR/AcrR family transcriptional regulator [Leptospira sp.]